VVVLVQLQPGYQEDGQEEVPHCTILCTIQHAQCVSPRMLFERWTEMDRGIAAIEHVDTKQ
jgi:hypothetical protein